MRSRRPDVDEEEPRRRDRWLGPRRHPLDEDLGSGEMEDDEDGSRGEGGSTPRRKTPRNRPRRSDVAEDEPQPGPWLPPARR